MIITMNGTDKGGNHVKWAAAMIGSMLSLSNNKKVCIIQLSHNVVGLETTMVGKIDKGNETGVDTNRLMISDNGIDNLMRKAATMKLTMDHFQNSCRCMLKTENRLDVLGISKANNFIDSLKAEGKIDDIKRIIRSADEFYNFVIVVLPSNEWISSQFIPMADHNICCVRQADAEEIYIGYTKEKKSDKDPTVYIQNSILVTNFDEESMYNLNVVQKIYRKNIDKEELGSKIKFKVYAMPYNIRFNDACYSNDLLRWIYKNYNASISDINYNLIHSMQKFVNEITGTEEEEAFVPTLKKRQKFKKEPKEKKQIKAEDISSI